MSAANGLSGHGLSARSTGHIGPIVTVPLIPDAVAIGVMLVTVSVSAALVEFPPIVGVPVLVSAPVAVERAVRVLVSPPVDPPQAATPAQPRLTTSRIAYLMLIPGATGPSSVPQ
ncbi:MAG: hypothetical protein HY873_01985 [Chloroflexi bacterium]|nr:hypothetical protein [Chloroflexota bacterium]